MASNNNDTTNVSTEDVAKVAPVAVESSDDETSTASSSSTSDLIPSTQDDLKMKKRPASSPLDAATVALVTPLTPAKRQRVSLNQENERPTPSYQELYGDDTASPSRTATAASMPSYQDLYGDDGFHSIQVPSLSSFQTQRHQYKRRNSVTKFSLQAAQHMSVLEAARKTLEKMRQEKPRRLSQDNHDGDEGTSTRRRPPLDLNRRFQSAWRR